MLGRQWGSLGVILARTRLGKRLRAGFVLTVLGIAAFSLAACGRAGPPEPPPGPLLSAYPPPAAAPLGPAIGAPVAAAPVTPEQAQKTGFDAYGNPVAPPSERKSFFLDFLLQ
jgi:Prokaryotic lipoprotein-attachment site